MIIKDKINQMLDTLPEEELDNVYWFVYYLRNIYLHKWNLFGKGVKVTYLFEESEKLMQLWEYNFTRKISNETKESIYYNQFKWHIYSYEKEDCLKEEAAREAFDVVLKDEIYVMYQNSPFVMLYSNATELISTDFDNEQDIYIFDKSCTWTYVNTHESMCGPYFATKVGP